MVKIVLIPSGATTWTVPADCQSAQVDCIGEGQNGRGTVAAGNGGIAGAFARLNTITLMPGASIPVQIGPGNSGNDTWFSTSTTVKAQSGVNGGLASGSIGDVKHSGGLGGGNAAVAGGGGGGAGGPNGAGAAGTAGAANAGPGGTGDAGAGGAGGAADENGGPGAEYSLTVGGSTGSGGGGGGAQKFFGPAGFGGNLGAGGGGNNAGLLGSGAGAPGGIIVTYQPITTSVGTIASLALIAGIAASSAPSSAVVHSVATVAGTARATARASSAVNSPSSVTAVGRSIAASHAAISSSSAVSGATNTIVQAAGSVSSAATMSPVGHALAAARGSAASTAIIAGSGSLLRTARGMISSTASLAGAGASLARAHGTISSVAAVTGYGNARKFSSGTITATSTITGRALSTAHASGSLSSSASVAVTGKSTAATHGTAVSVVAVAGVSHALSVAHGVVASAATIAAAGNAIKPAAGSISAATAISAVGNALAPAHGALTSSAMAHGTGFFIQLVSAAGSVTSTSSVSATPLGIAAARGAITSASAALGAVQYAPKPSGQSVQESLNNQSQLKAALDAGLNTLSNDQIICFQKYIKVVLPLDGFVFWVKADLLSPSALFNANQYNQIAFGQPPAIVSGPNEICAQGSLHHTIINRQDPDQAVAVNHMVFTSEVEIQDLNDVSPQMIYMACVDNELFAFSERKSFYKNAGIYHYAGDAVFPTMRSQIINNVRGFDAQSVVVSNSLPIWLSLNQIMPIYPAYLVPDNLRPPFATIDVTATDALQAAPFIDSRSNHYQLARDRVRVTIFGLRNNAALDYQDLINAYMSPEQAGAMGLMSTPITTDDHQWQTEISALAMKKSLTYEVSYNQQRIRDVARQFILECIPTLVFAD